MVKNIILCFDGTNENFGPHPSTNVLKIYQLLDNNSQLCYYQPGIGTASDFDSVADFRRRFSMSSIKNLIDSMFAFCLDDHIMSAYLFLMKHYQIGDSIYMFGFSRGAFIARVLAGMLERVGLLHTGLEDMVKMAWRIYESWEFAEQPSPPSYNNTLIEEFRKTFSRDYEIRVYFQGLFDSVNSVGLLRDRSFPLTQRSNIVDHVRHSLSIDERRGKFKQVCFTPNQTEPQSFSINYYNEVTGFSYGSILDSPDQRLPSNSRNIRNPLIRFTVKRWIGLESSNFVNSNKSIPFSLLNANPKDRKTEPSLLIKQVNEFISKSNPRASKDVEITNKMVQGIFEFQPQGSLSISSEASLTADLVEKWFPGDHSDVGGGWAVDCVTEENVSNLPLRWMLAEALKHGVKFRPGSIHEFAERHSSRASLFATIHDCLGFKDGHDGLKSLDEFLKPDRDDSFEVTITKIKLKDEIDLASLKKSFDEYELTKTLFMEKYGHLSRVMSFLWWILEFMPIGIRIVNSKGRWRTIYLPNLGKRRQIPEYGDMHWSVYWRIKFNPNYRPKNLPKYVNDIIREMENIDLGSSHFQNDTNSLVSDNYNISSEVSLIPNYDKSNTDSITATTNSKHLFYSTMTDYRYYYIHRKYIKWIEDSWRTIPDDLSNLLLSNSNL